MYYLGIMLSIHLFSFLILITECAEAYNKNVHMINVLFSLPLLSVHRNI